MEQVGRRVVSSSRISNVGVHLRGHDVADAQRAALDAHPMGARQPLANAHQPFNHSRCACRLVEDAAGVRYLSTGLPLVRVASAPAIGQYSVSGSTYTFNTGDNTAVVLVSYTFSVAASGTQLNIKNQLMGFAPTIQVLLETVYNSNQFSVLLYSVVASKLSFATKQEDFIIPEFDFEAFANAAGQVIDIYSNE